MTDRIDGLGASHEAGWRSGYIEAALGELDVLDSARHLDIGDDTDGVLSGLVDKRLGELVRRFGADGVQRGARSPEQRARIDSVVQRLAEASTVRLEGAADVCANGPEEIGGKGTPGGWTGGLAVPTPETPKARRRR